MQPIRSYGCSSTRSDGEVTRIWGCAGLLCVDQSFGAWPRGAPQIIKIRSSSLFSSISKYTWHLSSRGANA
jgi:hypothetical protein